MLGAFDDIIGASGQPLNTITCSLTYGCFWVCAHLSINDMRCVGVIFWAGALMPDEAHDLVLTLSWLI